MPGRFRIERGRAQLQLARKSDRFGREPVVRRHRLPAQVLGVGPGRMQASAALGLGMHHLQMQRPGDGLRHLGLQHDQVLPAAVAAIGPQLGTALRVDEAQIQPHLVAEPLDAAFEDVAHAEVATDLANLDRLALVRVGGAAGDDEAVGMRERSVVRSSVRPRRTRPAPDRRCG